MRLAAALPFALFVSACTLAGRPPAPVDPGPVVEAQTPDAQQIRPLRRPDFSTRAPDAPEPAPRSGATTLAGLGDPTQPGLWLRTGLVSAVQAGRVTTEAGRTLDLELRPSGGDPGSGSQISLAAMQALGLPLAALASLRVDPL